MSKERALNERRPLGGLEQEVLKQLWKADEPLAPGEVLAKLPGELAYSTVMTILTRLWEKGLAKRERRGRAYTYSPVVSEAELTARRMRAQLARAVDREAALSRFVTTLTKREERILRRIMSELDES